MGWPPPAGLAGVTAASGQAASHPHLGNRHAAGPAHRSPLPQWPERRPVNRSRSPQESQLPRAVFELPRVAATSPRLSDQSASCALDYRSWLVT